MGKAGEGTRGRTGWGGANWIWEGEGLTPVALLNPNLLRSNPTAQIHVDLHEIFS